MQAAANEQVPVNPSVMTDDEVREALFEICQDITTKAQDITTQANMEFIF